MKGEWRPAPPGVVCTWPWCSRPAVATRTDTIRFPDALLRWRYHRRCVEHLSASGLEIVDGQIREVTPQ